MYDNQNAANLIVNLGVRLGGELAKQTLLLTLKAIEHHKQNKQYQKGMVKLKTLLKSNENLGVININKDSLADFKKACKRSHIQFGSISNGEKVKVFYKVSQAEMVKDVLTDILEKEKANKVDRIEEMQEFKSNENENRAANIKDNEDERKAFETIENKLDFETIDDENYRFNKENVSNEEATKFKEEVQQGEVYLLAATSATAEESEKWLEDIKKAFPEMTVLYDKLSLGVSCHIGPGGLGIGCSCRPKRITR